MDTSIILAMTLAALVGVALGLLGGGGSILTFPIFSLVLGIGTRETIVSSLFVVAITSAVSAAFRVRRREVRWKVAGVFAATGLIGGIGGGMVGQLLPETVLTVLFAAIMIVTAIAMMRPRRERAARPPTRPVVRGIRTTGTGLGVGVLTGALGAGGGFLIVPALTFLGQPIAAAVGTSLLVIAVNSSAGFLTQITTVAIHWPIVLTFTALAVAGSFIGLALSHRLPAAGIRTGFGVLVLAVGLTMLATLIIQTLSRLTTTRKKPMPHATDTAPRTGEHVDGYEVPVLDEHAVRIAAGILLAIGITALTITLASDSIRPLQMFGMFFLLDMTTRVLISDRLSLTLALGRALTRRRRRHWVGAPQKVFAWWLALGLAAISCVTMSAGMVPLPVTLGLCGVCFTVLLLEATLGWCAGCALHQRFSRQPTRHCANGACDR